MSGCSGAGDLARALLLRCAWSGSACACFGRTTLAAATGDGRRLLRSTEARAYVSLWQGLLGVASPAVTATCTEPGEWSPTTARARLLGTDGAVLVLYDLDSCVLKRVPVARRGFPCPPS